MKMNTKYHIISLLVAICFVTNGITANAQQVDTQILSFVGIGDVNQVNNTTLEFDLTIQRNSYIWDRWANGTFQVKISGVADDRYTDQKMRVTLINGTSQLNPAPYQNAVLTNYTVTPRVFPGRISITVLGPDEYLDCKVVPLDTTIRIGRFRVEMLDSARLGAEVTWVTPVDYYQANAYKLETDSINAKQVKWYNANDNVEMRNYARTRQTGTTTVYTDSFKVAPPPERCFELQPNSFVAGYLGDRFVNVSWATLCEQAVQGYILRRRVINCPGMKPSELEFYEVRRFGPVYDTAMNSKGNTRTGFPYQISTPDTVDFRAVTYEYELSALFFDGQRRYIDTTAIRIPNSVISRSFAGPNPIEASSNSDVNICYTLDDRVRLSIKVYDITGKELATLMDKEIKPRTPRTHEDPKDDVENIKWHIPDQASQGLYNVLLIAYPVDDPSIELSRSVIKLQLLR
ncbi:MAG: hypothetical protein JNJ85_15065 [Candidatus Kapabacteria bacterium]|nr:hypothetical protein [Candidatus Kapabacteria bacterium]